MKKEDLYNALSKIDMDYIAESDNFEAVSADFKREKKRKKRIVTSTFCFTLIGIGVFGASGSSLFKSDLQIAEKRENFVTSTWLQTEKVETVTEILTKQPVLNENMTGDKTDLYYSDLVKSIEVPELDGYHDQSASLDISAFDETMLNSSELAGVVEGEIIDIWVNYYEYATACDKFEPDGQLHHKESTVAYKIRVDKVLSGDFLVGDIVTVEDRFFILDSIISVKNGGNYVIPIGNGKGVLYEGDEILSGSNIMESSYYTLYQFQPQIQKVSGGYVVPGRWRTLTDECAEIIMDIDNIKMRFPGSLYFVPDNDFDYRMGLILQNNTG